jgi:hypothetical protein
MPGFVDHVEQDQQTGELKGVSLKTLAPWAPHFFDPESIAAIIQEPDQS